MNPHNNEYNIIDDQERVMPLPLNKAELLNRLNTAYNKLDQELETITPALERDPGIEGGISCCDVIAYQIGWGKLLMGWDATEAAAKTPTLPAKGFKWNQLNQLAQSFYANAADKSLATLRADFCDLVKSLNQWIQSLSESALFDLHYRQWAGEKWPLVKWIQVNTIAPYGSARTKIRRWKKSINLAV